MLKKSKFFKGVPARYVLAYLCAFIPLASGIGLLWQRAAAPERPIAHTTVRHLLPYALPRKRRLIYLN
jgi:hypothetical protein